MVCLGVPYYRTYFSMQKVNHFYRNGFYKKFFYKKLRLANIMVLFVNRGNGKLKTGEELIVH